MLDAPKKKKKSKFLREDSDRRKGGGATKFAYQTGSGVVEVERAAGGPLALEKGGGEGWRGRGLCEMR